MRNCSFASRTEFTAYIEDTEACASLAHVKKQQPLRMVPPLASLPLYCDQQCMLKRYMSPKALYVSLIKPTPQISPHTLSPLPIYAEPLTSLILIPSTA